MQPLLAHITLRPFSLDDVEALAGVYRDSVRGIGPDAYTSEQVAMWASYPDDMQEFRNRMSKGRTLVAVEDGDPIAFGQLYPDDHLALLYCATARARLGIGSIIYSALEAHAFGKGIDEIRTEASRISRPFFEKHGYVLIEVEHTIRSGVEFERFRMRKRKPC